MAAFAAVKQKKFVCRGCAFFLVLFLTVGFCACGEGQKVISDQALTLFNKAISVYNISDCRSEARAAVIAYTEGSSAPIFSYVQCYESLMHNKGGASVRRTDAYFLSGAPNPLESPVSAMTHFSTCYLDGDTIFYSFPDEQTEPFFLEFREDYFSAVGLYSLSDCLPQALYAVSSDGEIRADLRFSAETCREKQKAYIISMTTGLFGEEREVRVSEMTASAFINEKNNRFSRYTISFTGTADLAETALRLEFTYTERFFDYGTTEKIVLPDKSGYKPL